MLDSVLARHGETDPEPARPEPFFSRTTKISLICYPYAPILSGRGIDRYSYFLYESLKQMGVQAKIVGVPPSKHTLTRIAMAEPRLTWEIYRASGSLFHAVSPVGGGIAALTGRRPLITSIHDVIPFFLRGYSPLKYAFLRFCIGISARASDALIVPFEITKRFLVHRFGIEPERVKVVSYGVDLTGFKPGTRRQGEERRILFLGGGFPTIRGGNLLIRAFSQVSHEITHAQLLLAGTGPEIQPLKALVGKLGLRPRVRFIGFIKENELAQYFRSVDVLVHPSRLGFSLSVLQAMACRTPVVVSDDLDLPEFVRDSGVVCRSGSSEGLSRAILRVLADGGFAEFIAQKGYERSKDFSLNRMIHETLQVYSELADARDSGPQPKPCSSTS